MIVLCIMPYHCTITPLVDEDTYPDRSQIRRFFSWSRQAQFCVAVLPAHRARVPTVRLSGSIRCRGAHAVQWLSHAHGPGGVRPGACGGYKNDLKLHFGVLFLFSPFWLILSPVFFSFSFGSCYIIITILLFVVIYLMMPCLLLLNVMLYC